MNGDFTFSGNILTPEGRAAFDVVQKIKSDWDMANQDRLTQCPMRLRLDADDETLAALYRKPE